PVATTRTRTPGGRHPAKRRPRGLLAPAAERAGGRTCKRTIPIATEHRTGDATRVTRRTTVRYGGSFHAFLRMERDRAITGPRLTRALPGGLGSSLKHAMAEHISCQALQSDRPTID